MRKYIFGGNWKMQKPRIITSTVEAKHMVDLLSVIDDVDIFIAPSPNAMYEVGQVLKGTNLKLAGQNMHHASTGAFTGEVSVEALLEAGCEYVLLGHSERRRIFNETSSDINKKVIAALDHGLKVVLCIGETAKERADGQMERVNTQQLEQSLIDVSGTKLSEITIAYEPVWAINNEFLNPGIEIRPATIEEANASHAVVRNWIKNKYGSDIAENMRIQYGGSMKESNARELLAQQDIDGGLVGGASLKADTFIPIIRSIE